VAIAGGGNVGQSIARSLLAASHKVLVIERERLHYRPDLAPAADWMLADACELSALQAAGIETADVVIAATGDDKVNLVFAMLCKTEFAVPRVVARVNNPNNQWLFSPAWGVDVAVSTPRSLVASVEEAVTTGDVVHLMTLQHGQGSIIEVTLPAGSPLSGRPVTALDVPGDAALLGVARDGTGLLTPGHEVLLQGGDEIVLLVAADAEERVRAALLPRVS
jgi:trk system potassium uptake protein TrkA